MLARARALLIPLIFAPLAAGCTLWYLAADPFDGLGGGADAEGGSATDGAFSEASPDDEASACGPLTSNDNCGACGVTCDVDAGSTCWNSTVGGPSNCGAQKIDTSMLAHAPQAIAVGTDGSLYLLDLYGGVFRCDADCNVFTQLNQAGANPSACYLTTSDRGLFWSQTNFGDDGIYHINYDGGLRPMLAAHSPEAVATQNGRVAWTSDLDDAKCTVFDDNGDVGVLSYAAATAGAGDGGPAPITVDVQNIAVVANGTGVAATTNGARKLLIATLQDDGGISPPIDFGDGGSTNFHIASNGNDVFFTSASGKDPGNVYEVSPDGGGLIALASTNKGLNKGAPIFVGADGTVYWSDTNFTLSYCLPTASGARCTSVTTLTIEQGAKNAVVVTQIAATSKHIFFTVVNTLYRVDRL